MLCINLCVRSNLRQNTTMVIKLINLFLRGTTLLSKFVLIFILARYLSEEDVGRYGLLAATIAYGGCTLGVEFYTYSTRKILATPKELWADRLRDSSVFYAISYAIWLPLFLLLFEFSILPYKMLLMVYPLLILEHIGMEFNRFFIVVSEVLFASFLIFLRTSAWILVVIPCLITAPVSRNLELIFIAWGSGSLLACILGGLKIKKMILLPFQNPIDWSWIFTGFKRASLFYVSSMSLLSLHVLDRYLIEYLWGYHLLSSYVLFSGISNALGTFLDAGVFVFHYPKMITAYNEQNKEAFYRILISMSKQTVLLAVAFCITVYFLLDVLLAWLDKSVYYDNVNYCYWLLLVAVMKALSLLPHYALYACNVDKPIVQSNVLSFILFLILGGISLFQVGSLTVPMMLICCFALQLAWCGMAWRKCSKVAL